MNTHPQVFSRKNPYYIFDKGHIKDYEGKKGYDGYIDVVDENFNKVGEIHAELLDYLKGKERIFSPSFLIEEIEDAILLVDAQGRIFLPIIDTQKY